MVKPAPGDPVAAFKSWVTTAPPGEQYAYHVGLLARDRFEGDDESRPREPVHGLARAVWLAHMAGLVLLTQRRRDTISFYYIATRSARRTAQ